MSVQAAIEKKLQDIFKPDRLDVINESHLHAGHAGGFDGAGETHFRVRIMSQSFAGKSRIERHRAVNETLKAELASGVHALAVEPAAPGEPVRW